MSSGYARHDENMLWLSLFQEASLRSFKCDSSIHNFVIINYSGLLSDPNSTKKPGGVLGNFVITRKSYVFDKYFARLRNPPNFFEKDYFLIVYSY